MLRRVALATWAACALFVFPVSHASAGLLPKLPIPSLSLPPLLPQLPLPTSSPLPLPRLPIIGDLLPTPTVTGVPPIPLPGQLNDTITSITGLLGGSKGTPSPGPVTGGSGSGVQQGGGHNTGSTGAKGGHKGGSSTNPAIGSLPGLTTLDGIGVISPGESFTSPYGTVTGQAVRKAAGRALSLAAPLAAPLLLACIALGVLLMLSRGSTRLVKLDVAGLARRTWRI